MRKGLLDRVVFAVSCSSFLDDYEKGVAVIGILLDTIRRDNLKQRTTCHRIQKEGRRGTKGRRVPRANTDVGSKPTSTGTLRSSAKAEEDDSTVGRLEVVGKTEEMGLVSSYGVEAVGSVGSGQRVVSSHEERRTGRSSNGEEPFSEEPKLTVKIARQMRAEMDEAVAIRQRKLEMMRIMQWKVGDPLPFELMTERDKKESIRKKAEAEERARKLEMSALLESTGPLASPPTGSHGEVQSSAGGEGQTGEGSREETEESSA
ncbi:hypothetical protein BLNAU_20689 [Blattamonas nauphoetae]|uniref:Uncharacterized protein n=1 Tax=Blattamonas nauphoetae TaxID=2049346 RepID=A0ABQ9WXZ8_9EUKA|nr:hypothetical protein BLNAU_20689 [Blattamonas nauphoetae]